MSLFVCSKCGYVENTALTVGKDRLGYWGHSDNPLCSKCLTGKWHGCFRRVKFNPKRWQYVKDNKDFVERR